MSVDDRVGLAAHVVNQDDKLCRTFSVPVHGWVQNVSQGWEAGPLRVRLEERGGETVVVAEAPWPEMVLWAQAAGFEYERIVHWAHLLGDLRWELRLTPALDRFLVELVDVIADVRRAAGTVQLELEGLEEQGAGGDGR